MARKGKSKTKRTQQTLEKARQEAKLSEKGEPCSMVIQRGKTKLATRQLKMDLRQLMRPLTAMKLKDSGKNHLKDFVEICGPLGVTHMLILTATDNSHWLKMTRVPQGPTISFRIASHTLVNDIKTAYDAVGMYNTSPLMVLTGFTSEKHHKLATIMMQTMFPTIDLGQTDVRKKKRVLLLHYNGEKDVISFRHYGISLRAAGLSKGLRALAQRKLPTGIDGMQDISEILTKGGYGSESEGEDLDVHDGHVRKRQKVKLREIGPRMDLELVKIEEGVCDGLVLYHRNVKKSLEEVAEIQRRREKRAMLKAMRKKEQAENVKRKKEEKERRKVRKHDPVVQANAEAQKVVDDDREYYQQEVGEEPDEHFGVKVDRSAAKFVKRRRNSDGGAQGVGNGDSPSTKGSEKKGRKFVGGRRRDMEDIGKRKHQESDRQQSKRTKRRSW